MRNPLAKYSRQFWNAERRKSLYEGLALLAVAVIIQIFAGQYSMRHSIGANAVNDILLDNLPAVNLDFMIVGGGIALWMIGWYLLITRPRALNFGIKTIALFIITRAFFFSLTHIGPYPLGIPLGPDNLGWGFYKLITFQGNFFFSGHTGFPFLMALLLWEDDTWRLFFLVMSVLFGACVLLAHVHYSIDVFAAPFIVHGVYRISQHFFSEDYASVASS
jgi:hypothetical protein